MTKISLYADPKKIKLVSDKSLRRLTGASARPVELTWAFKDSDRDRVPNILDCQPYNPRQQGWLHSTGAWVARKVGVPETAEKLERKGIESDIAKIERKTESRREAVREDEGASVRERAERRKKITRWRELKLRETAAKAAKQRRAERQRKVEQVYSAQKKKEVKAAAERAYWTERKKQEVIRARRKAGWIDPNAPKPRTGAYIREFQTQFEHIGANILGRPYTPPKQSMPKKIRAKTPQIVVIGNIPKTRSGKINTKKLKAIARQAGLAEKQKMVT